MTLECFGCIKKEPEQNSRNKNLIKKDQSDILTSLSKYKMMHIVCLILAVTFKITQYFFNNQPLPCNHADIIESLTSADRNNSRKSLSIHTSADVEAAIQLELEFACYYKANCSDILPVWNDATINFNTPLNTTLPEEGCAPIDTDCVTCCPETLCPPDAFGLPEDISMPSFIQLYDSYHPRALQANNIFVFWDFLWIFFGMLVWYRVQSLKDMNLVNVPVVIDEKDIGTISLQCLLATVTMVFYATDAACSWLWLYLHDRERLQVEHASYFTVEARNKSLAAWHTCYVLLIMNPAIFLSVQMKKKLCKYEELQFARES
ncbi:Oidioi.mRNA.OKI2018_I69.chr1.g3075.t1.cds [Oikopleura dioica]|uniref:Oidioi.mRNA.OKI2018_I69.chr1.g3075.t1.cds n=1 Tax=Oikopleura dioica TaxID=34765 RepID=A0ABN7SYG9_OIKDI|nr:Oidioi.mRNA.OKI2018_I69.chr1.g3075.t1.cds [Oikopleura dioica]